MKFLFVVLVLTALVSCASAKTVDVGSAYTVKTVQAGIDASVAGDTVYVHAGTYTITTCIKPKSGIILRGDGVNTVIKSANWNTFHDPVAAATPAKEQHGSEKVNMIYLKGVTNFEMYGFTVHGGATDKEQQHNNGGKGDCRNSMYIGTGCSNIKIHDIYFTLGCGDCIYGYSSSNVQIYNCQMIHPGHDGIQLWGACSKWTISNCNIDWMINSGIRIASGSNGILFSHNTVTTTYGGGAGAIELEGAGSGNVIDHCVFKKAPVFWHPSGVACTIAFTNNICYTISLPTSGTDTLSPNSGNTQTSTSSNWAAAGYGFDPSKLGSGAGTPLDPDPIPEGAYPGTPLPLGNKPTQGGSLLSSAGIVTLQWDNVNSTQYTLQIATDSAFTAPIYNQVVTTYSVDTPLGNGTYYWRVKAMNDVTHAWTAYTPTSSFTLTGSGSASGNLPGEVSGHIYEFNTAKQVVPIHGATVFINGGNGFGGNWSSTTVTNSDGYYVFTNTPADVTDYTIFAQATDYLATPAGLYVSTDGGEGTLDIYMVKAPTYFQPNYVTISVINNLYQGLSDVGVVVYLDNGIPFDKQNPVGSGAADSQGHVTFKLDQIAPYIFVAVDSGRGIDGLSLASGSAHTHNYGSDSAPTIICWGVLSKNQFTPDAVKEPYDYISFYEPKPSYPNMTYGYINLSARSRTTDVITWNIDVNSVDLMTGLPDGAFTWSNSGTGNYFETVAAPRNATYVVNATIAHPQLDEAHPYDYSVFLKPADLMINLGYKDQWNYIMLSCIIIFLTAGLFGQRNQGMGAFCCMLMVFGFTRIGWLAYDTIGLIMVMLGVLLVMTYLLTRRN